MKDVTLSIEKGWRLFEADYHHISRYFFYVIQLNVKKDLVSSGHYELSIRAANYSKKRTVIIDYENEKVIDVGSHEDPLVQSSSHIMISFHIYHPSEKEDVPYKGAATVELKSLETNEVLVSKTFSNISELFSGHQDFKYSHIDGYLVYTSRDAVLRMHIGDQNGVYSEQKVVLSAGECFNLAGYLLNNAYVGVQLSYSDLEPEIEEKYILNGLKGMRVSVDYLSKEGVLYSSLLPYQSRYKVLECDSGVGAGVVGANYAGVVFNDTWVEVSSVDALQEYLSKVQCIPVFEVQPDFLLPIYSTRNTYSQLRLVHWAQVRGVGHYSAHVCQSCPMLSYCMQVVPSGLSYSLLKKMITIPSPEQCDIYHSIATKMQVGSLTKKRCTV